MTSLIRTKPDLLILGAQKSGTTSLFKLLSEHPQINSSNIKEVHYFDDNPDKGMLWYRRHFPYLWKKTQWTLEATPYYLFHPLVPERISKTLPTAKLILLLRNPVDRAYSHYQMAKHDGYEPGDSFEEAILAEPERTKTRQAQQGGNHNDREGRLKFFSYLERGKYVDQINRYLNFFDRSQMFIIQSEVLFDNPETIFRSLCGFLEIDYDSSIVLEKSNNQHYEKMNPDTRRQLASYFRPFNKQLSELLNQKFSWDDDKTIN